MQVIIDGVEYVPSPPVSELKGIAEALEIRFDSDAGDNLTIRDYLYILLRNLWDEQEGFNGKRPFGNSGWDFELYKPLIAGGFISGSLDEEGYIEDYSRQEAHKYVQDLVTACFYSK